jgi:hypothetical protein
MLVNFIPIWSIGRLEYFVAIWYILWSFGISIPRYGVLGQEKYGNHAT